MRWYTCDQLRRDVDETGAPRTRRWTLFNRTWRLTGVPRLALTCRVVGHLPVVDGTAPRTTSRPDGTVHTDPGARWVACARCLVRGDPQGSLDPAVFAIGEPYRGPWFRIPARGPERWDALQDRKLRFYPPGPIAEHATTDISGQLVIGPHYRPHRVGWQAKIGNDSSENSFSGAIYLGWLGSFYWNTGSFGRGVARRLNPGQHYTSRVTGFDLELKQFSWKLWAPRDSWSRDDPKWMQGSVNLNPVDRICGPRRYSYTAVDGGQVHRIVRTPDGKEYLVRLRLERRTLARRRWSRTRHAWTVDWHCEGRGIPVKNAHHSGVFGSGVDVDGRDVRAGTWPSAAVAEIVRQIVRYRTGYGWEPTGPVPIRAGA